MPFLVKSQDLWTLDRCVKYAIENNIQVKQKQLDVQQSEENVKASKAAFYPSVNGSSDMGYSWGRVIDKFTNDFTTQRTQNISVGISSGVTLFHGFELKNSLKRDVLNLKASLADIEKLKNDISLNVATTFLQIIYNEELLKVSKEQQLISEAQVERTMRLVDAGKSTKGNLLEVQAQLEQDKLKIINDDNTLRTSYLTLVQLLELKDASTFKIQIPEIVLPSVDASLPPIDTVFQLAMENLPEFKTIDYQIQSAQKNIEIAKSGHSPRLSMYGGYSTGYSDAYNKSTIGTQFTDNQSKSLSFSLSIPIFNNRRTEVAVNKATIGLQYTQTSLQLAKNSIYKDIQRAHNDANAAYNKFKVSEKVVEATSQSYSYSEQKFNAGVISSIEYNTAKTQLAKVKTELLQAKYEFIFRLAIIDYYMGKGIKI
jgi:outer membrane protein